MKTIHSCPHCTAELETNEAGLAGHLKKCRKARQWERDYYLERGKWPGRKVNKTNFCLGGGSRRAGRDPNSSSYNG
jgi:hypothetical protein